MASSSKQDTDSLPKVIICGITEANIPKLIVCEEEMKQSRTCAAGLCKNQEEEESGSLCYPQTCPPCPSPAYSPPSCPPPSCSPPPCGPPECMSPEQKNAMLRAMQNKLQCDIMEKQQTIENLQRNLFSLQCEMDCASKQNTKLAAKLQQMCDSQQSVGASRKDPCGKDMVCMQNKLDDFSENTKSLEQQVCDMLNSMKSMKRELLEVQAEREKLNKNKTIYMVLPPTCPPMPPPNCNGGEQNGSCSSRPSPCFINKTCH